MFSLVFFGKFFRLEALFGLTGYRLRFIGLVTLFFVASKAKMIDSFSKISGCLCCKISKFLSSVARNILMTTIFFGIFCFQLNGCLFTCCRLSDRSANTKSLFNTRSCLPTCF